MRPIQTASLIAAAVALLFACSDDDDAAPTSTAAPSVATQPSAPTTEATRPTTASPTTTSAPSTTIDEIAATKAAVAAAAVQSRQDYLYAVRNYDAADALEVLGRSTAPNSPAWEQSVGNMETLRSNGWRSRENPDVPSILIVEGDVELLDGPPATRAEVVVCTIDSGVVFEPGGAPDGSDAIVNDEITAIRDRLTMVLQDGAWKLSDGSTIDFWDETTSCPAA